MRIHIAILNRFRVDRDTIRYGTIQYITVEVLYLNMVRYATVRVLFFFYNLPAVDRGCRSLLAAYHHCPPIHYTQLATAHPTPTIPCNLFKFSSGDIFSNVAHPALLLAAGGGLDNRVTENKHRKTMSPPKSSAFLKP